MTLAVDPIMLDDGRRRCPVPQCNGKTFDSPQGWGAHARIHSPNGERTLRVRNLGAMRRATVKCPMTGCDARVLGSGLRSHLRDQHRRMSARDVVDTVNRAIAQFERARSTSLQRVEPEPEPRRSTVRQVPVDDAAVAVLLGTTGTDTIAISDVPAVTDWLTHTRALVEHLRVDDSDD